MIVRILLLFIALFTFGAQAQAIKESYAFAVLGEPRYAFNFNHFDYVNPAAPKGGQITLSALGTFDNFNRYALRGNPGARTEQLYDTLFTTSDDEPGSYYPLIAESARYADDYSWVEVAINPRARFHDGSPITARDVEFTFRKFMTEGVPQFRLVYKGTTVKAIAPLTVRIELAKASKEDMLSLFSLPVFPEKYWKDHKLSDPLATPPLASGPYRVTSWKMGQNIVYSRVKDYWAANLPVNRGRWNFDTIRYDYYLDDNVAFEAFKAGAFDLRMENDAKNWLEKEGITTAFGVPGAAINPFYSAMRKHGGIRHILARHVEGASHMAEGYTRATAGNIGVCLGTSGPAGTDMITALYSASADSIPIFPYY